MSARLESWLAYQIHGRMTSRTYPKRRIRASRRPRAGSEPQYLAFVRKLPCMVCYADFWGYWLGVPNEARCNLLEMVEILNRGAVQRLQETPTEAAHLGFSTSLRGLGQKYPDLEAIPLCRGHHTQQHQATAGWWERTLPDLDRDAILKALGEVYRASDGDGPA